MNANIYLLSKKNISKLTAYYVGILIFGLFLTTISLLFEPISIKFNITVSISTIALIGGIGTSLCGSTIFYMRKIYKLCINSNFKIPTSKEEELIEFGLKYYFYLRPLYSIAFSFLIHLILKSGVQIITITDSTLSVGYIYLVMLLSFFAGFAAGDLITYLETIKKDIINKTFNKI